MLGLLDGQRRSQQAQLEAHHGLSNLSDRSLQQVIVARPGKPKAQIIVRWHPDWRPIGQNEYPQEYPTQAPAIAAMSERPPTRCRPPSASTETEETGSDLGLGVTVGRGEE